jgi:hypothetical protein
MVKKNTGKPQKFLDQARDIMRRRHFSRKTEQNYTHVLRQKGIRPVKSTLDA